MIDNFELISTLLKYNSDDEFYFLQVIKRKKDQPEELKGSNNSARLIKSYYINSVEHLMSLKEEIIDICKVFNARAGINLNKRSYKKCALQTVRTILDQMDNENYKSSRRAFNTVCGKYSIGDKHWILDYDGGELYEFEKVFLEKELYHFKPIGDKVLAYIPTRQGVHIITKPFNLFEAEDFLKELEISVHKNNPTILYIN